MSLEEVLLKAADATIWVNPGGASGIQDIIREDETKAFISCSNRPVANNNKRLNQAGGNDYWESAVVHPMMSFTI